MKVAIVVMIAALSAAVGEAILSYSVRRLMENVPISGPAQVGQFIISAFSNPSLYIGIFFLAVFFFLYLAALSRADFSYVQPLTAASYIFAAFLAKFFLKEDISLARWIGTFIIVMGIAFVALDEARSASGYASADYSQKN